MNQNELEPVLEPVVEPLDDEMKIDREIITQIISEESACKDSTDLKLQKTLGKIILDSKYNGGGMAQTTIDTIFSRFRSFFNEAANICLEVSVFSFTFFYT